MSDTNKVPTPRDVVRERTVTTRTESTTPPPVPARRADATSATPPVTPAVAARPARAARPSSHEAEHPIRNFKQYHEEIFTPTLRRQDEKLETTVRGIDETLAGIRSKIETISREIDGADRRASRVRGNPGIGIKDSLTLAHAEIDRLKKDVDRRLAVIERDAKSGNPLLVRKAQGDAEFVDETTTTAFDAVSLQVRDLDQRITDEVRRLDGRIDGHVGEIERLWDGQKSVHRRLVTVEQHEGFRPQWWAWAAGFVVGFIVFVIRLFVHPVGTATITINDHTQSVPIPEPGWNTFWIALVLGIGFGAITVGILGAVSRRTKRVTTDDQDVDTTEHDATLQRLGFRDDSSEPTRRIGTADTVPTEVHTVRPAPALRTSNTVATERQERDGVEVRTATRH